MEYVDGIEQIREVEEWDGVVERSHQRPVMVFKHSLTCGISAGALRRYQEYVERNVKAGDEAGDGREVEFTLLEVQTSRPLSNAIAEATGIRHQSPQAILLRDGEAVWDTSHGRITGEALDDALGGPSAAP